MVTPFKTKKTLSDTETDTWPFNVPERTYVPPSVIDNTWFEKETPPLGSFVPSKVESASFRTKFLPVVSAFNIILLNF